LGLLTRRVVGASVGVDGREVGDLRCCCRDSRSDRKLWRLCIGWSSSDGLSWRHVAALWSDGRSRIGGDHRLRLGLRLLWRSSHVLSRGDDCRRLQHLRWQPSGLNYLRFHHDLLLLLLRRLLASHGLFELLAVDDTIVILVNLLKEPFRRGRDGADGASRSCHVRLAADDVGGEGLG